MRALEDSVLMATDEDDLEAGNLLVYPERLNESLTHYMQLNMINRSIRRSVSLYK